MTHQDFIYQPEPPLPARGQGTPTPKSAQAQANELSHRAAVLCWQISSTEPVANWKARIEQAPEELRECLREFLRQKWRERQDKAKRQAARDSEVAKAEIAKMKTIAEGL